MFAQGLLGSIEAIRQRTQEEITKVVIETSVSHPFATFPLFPIPPVHCQLVRNSVSHCDMHCRENERTPSRSLPLLRLSAERLIRPAYLWHQNQYGFELSVCMGMRATSWETGTFFDCCPCALARPRRRMTSNSMPCHSMRDRPSRIVVSA